MPEDRDGPRPETWTITFGFIAHDEPHARTAAQHASRRLASVLPGFDKNMVALARETDPYTPMPVYCDNDIYCAQAPGHHGACRAQDGTNLDHYDPDIHGLPAFGAEL